MFWTSVALIWVASAVCFIGAERYMAASGKSNAIWRSDDIAVSIAAYAVVIVISPFAFVYFAGIAASTGFRLLRERMSRVDQPFLPAEAFDQIPELFIGDLVRRRRRVDRRLKGKRVGDMMMWQLLETPEAMILDVVSKYSALKSADVADALIWEKLEAHRHEHGEGELPRECDLPRYVSYRLSIEDADYVKLGAQFLAGQIALCERHYRARLQRQSGREWPPVAWLQRQLSVSEFESIGIGIDPFAAGAPAVLSRGRDGITRELDDLKFLMLPSDQIWTFSSPPDYWQNLGGRAGIALIRKGVPVGHVITAKN